MKDMKPYSKKVVKAKSGAHMMAIANQMSKAKNPMMASPSKQPWPKKK